MIVNVIYQSSTFFYNSEMSKKSDTLKVRWQAMTIFINTERNI